MKNFVLYASCLFFLTQSPVFAMLDEDFKGDTLVVGGITKKDPDRLSVNIDESGDLKGSGWDYKFFQEKFTKGKYNHVLYERVGYSLQRCDANTRCFSPPKLAQALYDLLKPGGRFTFQSWGYVLASNDKAYTSEERMVLQYYNFRAVQGSTPKDMLLEIEGPGAENTISEYRTTLMPFLQNAFDNLNKNSELKKSVCALGEAGFKDIRVEAKGTNLFIYANKPE